MERSILVLAVVTVWAGCPEDQGPTPEDAAAYLGLAAGAAQSYQVAGNVTEVHEMNASSILSDEGIVFDRIAKQNGFVNQERTFSIEAGVRVDGRREIQYAQVRRFFDCINTCGELSAPIPLFELPLKDRQQTQTTVDVSTSQNGGAPTVTSETHTVLVGAEEEVTVPAGTFTGFTVSWSRSSDAGADTAILVVVPDVGVVRWDGFDGARLELLP